MTITSETEIMITRISLMILVSLLPLFSGCSGRHGKEQVLAEIGKEKIMVSDFNERIGNLPAKYKDIVKRREKEYLEELINDTLLYNEAIKKNLHKDGDVKKVIAEARKKILIARLLKDEVDDTISISEEDIARFYGENQARYMSPEIMRVSHILVLSPEEADNVLGEIKSGKLFEDMARAKSVDPTAQRGGDIGYFPKGQLMPEFESACAKLEIGDVSAVVKTSLGYHIIKLTDRRPPRLKPLEQVQDDIKARLSNIKRQETFNLLLSRLRESTEVVINEKVLFNNEYTTGDQG